MSRTSRHLRAQKQVEVWDDDPELDTDGALFGRLSTLDASASSNLSALSFSADDTAAESARRTAARDGIPLPRNVSPSALVGGQIRRLQTRQPPPAEDWDEFEDELLTLKPQKPAHHEAVSGLFKPTPPGVPDMFNKPDMFENFEIDFELPEDLTTIHLKSTRSVQPDSDAEGGWGDESTNSRPATKSISSDRSSVMSTFSPASSVTYESEEEGGLVGLSIPDGPLNFQRLLDMRMKDDVRPDPVTPTDDFLDGLEIGDGDDVFDTAKSTVNRNIKHKSASPRSPPATRPPPPVFAPKPTRIPRPVSQTAATMPPPPPQQEPPRPERRLSHKSSMMSVSQPSQRYGALLSKKSMPSLRPSADATFHAASQTPPLPSMPGWLSNPSVRRVASRTQDTPSAKGQDAGSKRVSTPRSALPRVSSLETKPPRRPLPQPPPAAASTPSPPTPPPRQVRGDSVRREAGSTKTLLKPVKRRLFGDGTELDGFDDLPISAVNERTFVSRRADVDGLGIKHAPPAVVPSVLNLRAAANPGAAKKPAPPKGRRKGQQRPHLIKPMGDIAGAARSEKGMRYNPATFMWEGNESIAREFETAAVTPPRPALISNIAAAKDVQVVGGMVFDPARMCWFKADQRGSSDEEDDPFEGFDDLVDDMAELGLGTPKPRGGGFEATAAAAAGGKRKDAGDVYGEFVVGEEFDVGPGFIGRQREEEDRWKRKVQGWIAGHETDDREYLYEIRRLIMRRK